MSHVRAAVRLLLLAVVSVTAVGSCLLARGLDAIRRGAGEGWARGTLRAWGRAACAILGLHVRCEGAPPRDAPFFLASNHLGYLDVITIAAHVPCRFVAKADVASWPVLGALARAGRTIFVDRTSRADLPRVVRLMDEARRAGASVTFFPEGTSSGGDVLLPFRTSLFEAPASAGYPVFCVSLSYATPAGAPAARTAVCWWGDMTFMDHFWGLLRLPRIDGRLAFASTPAEGADRKALAASARARIESVFTPMPGGGRNP